MANRKPFSYPRFRAFDGKGKPLEGGTAEFFDAGTTNNRTVYSDPELNTATPNPITLNSRGEPESGGGTPIDIYLDGKPYKIVLKDSDGNTVWTIDDYIAGDLPTGTGDTEVPTNSDIFADTLSDLQGKDTSGYSTTDTLYLRGRASVGDGGEGHFRWDSSDLSTEVGNDEVTAGEGDGNYFIAPASDKTGASGAWVRQIGYGHDYQVDSVSDLQSGSYPASLDRIWLLSGNEDAGGLYRDPGDTTTADNGETVIVDADGVRWKRERIAYDQIRAYNKILADKLWGVQRLQAVFDAEQIRRGAGIPSHVTLGPRSGNTPGLSDAGALTDDTRIAITAEADVSGIADSGSGTESDPYIVRDRRLDNSEGSTSTGGFNWDDPDAGYYIKVINCEIHGYDTSLLYHQSPNKLIFENCLFYETTNDPDIARGQGNASGSPTTEFHYCEFAGVAGTSSISFFALSGTAGHTFVARDCKWTESKTTWGAGAGVAQNVTGSGDNGTKFDIQYCDFTGAPSLDYIYRHNLNAEVTLKYLDIDTLNRSVLDPALSGNKWTAGLTYLYVRARNCGKHCINAPAGDGIDNFEIGYSDFDENGDDNRMVVLRDASNGRVHHCKFTNNSTTGGAGNEQLEAFDPVNVEFDHCWSAVSPEDCFEFVDPGEGCSIHHMVGDGAGSASGFGGQIVDVFSNNANADAEVEVNHIYGDSNSQSVVVTDTDNVTVHTVLADNADASSATGAVVVEQRDASADGVSPANCKVFGPLPLAEASADGNPFTTLGNVGSGNMAVWFEDEDIQTFGLSQSDIDKLVIR